MRWMAALCLLGRADFQKLFRCHTAKYEGSDTSLFRNNDSKLWHRLRLLDIPNGGRLGRLRQLIQQDPNDGWIQQTGPRPHAHLSIQAAIHVTTR